MHTPVTLTLFESVGLNKNVDALQLNPQLRYLRVNVDGRVLLMVMGYSEHSAAGTLETWYSSEGEVLRLLNGRIFSTAGLEVDWQAVRNTALPSWGEMLGRPSAQFVRERDEMPGYRFSITETVSLDSVPAQTNSKLVGLSASDLIWFEETVRKGANGVPSARYGLRVVAGVPSVVYGEQCLSNNFCFSWQTWPAKS
jgi:hypothetical protein